MEKGNDVLVDDGDEVFNTIWKLLEDSRNQMVDDFSDLDVDVAYGDTGAMDLTSTAIEKVQIYNREKHFLDRLGAVLPRGAQDLAGWQKISWLLSSSH